jgi:phosphoglycerate dehydrogenase-like enzyme
VAGEISRAVPGAVAKTYADLKDALADIETAVAAYGAVPPELFARAKKLRWICASRAGLGGAYFYDALVKSDVVATACTQLQRASLPTWGRFCSPSPGDSSTTGTAA